MKREIKFRAYSSNSGMWSWEKLKGNNPEPHPLSCLYSHDGWQVIQFTGLQDKEGVDVYEGDIYEYDYEYDADYDGDMPITKRAKGRECVKDIFERTKILRHRAEGGDVRVIGNIYENPELIK